MTSSEYIPLTDRDDTLPHTFLRRMRENKKAFDEARTRQVERKIKEWLSGDTDQTALKHDTNYLIALIESQSKLGINDWRQSLAYTQNSNLMCVQAASDILAKYQDDAILKGKSSEFMRAFKAYLQKTFTVLIMNVAQKTGIPVHERRTNQSEGIWLEFKDGYFYVHVWF